MTAIRHLAIAVLLISLFIAMRILGHAQAQDLDRKVDQIFAAYDKRVSGIDVFSGWNDVIRDVKSEKVN